MAGEWAATLFAGPIIGPGIVALEEAKIEAILLEHAAAMAGFDAEYVDLQTDVAERRLRKQSSQVIGAARVAVGGSGFAAESGSNLDAIEDIDRNIELNAQAIRAEGRVGVGKLQDKATSLRTQARVTSIFGKARAAGTILSGAKQATSLAVGAG